MANELPTRSSTAPESEERLNETPRRPYWMSVVAGIALIFTIAFVVLALLNMNAPPPPDVGAQGKWDNPNITGRFAGDKKQLEIRIADLNKEISRLEEHRTRLADAAERYRDAKGELPGVLAALLVDVEDRMRFLRAERDDLQQEFDR